MYILRNSIYIYSPVLCVSSARVTVVPLQSSSTRPMVVGSQQGSWFMDHFTRMARGCSTACPTILSVFTCASKLDYMSYSIAVHYNCLCNRTHFLRTFSLLPIFNVSIHKSVSTFFQIQMALPYWRLGSLYQIFTFAYMYIFCQIMCKRRITGVGYLNSCIVGVCFILIDLNFV